MASTVELMHLCRLCLVKEQVNVPIFEDQDEDSQIFMKIVTCLPVKINKDDKLPKKICGGCSYKLDLFYQFCNSTTNAEKQLLQWFNKVGFDDADNVDSQPEASKDIVDEAQADSISTETQSYILQQQQLPYGPVEFFQDDFDDSQPASGASESELVEESAVKKRKRATKNVSNKKSKTVVTTKTDASDDDDDDEDDVDVNDPNVMTFEDSKFSISCDRDVEEAGPSGIGKPDTPYEEVIIKTEHGSSLIASYQCEVCSQLFPDRKQYLEHHMSQFGSTFSCCRCNEAFKNSTELYQHYNEHRDEEEELEGEVIYSTEAEMLREEEIKEETVMPEEEEEYSSENMEAVMNIPGADGMDDGNELLYIIDDSTCVNEVIIEEADQIKMNPTRDNYTIVQVDHGYIIPSVFKGQLQSKRKYKKKEEKDVMYDDEDARATEVLVKMEPSTSKHKPTILRMPPAPKRRHEVPDFSATNYQLLSPNDEVDVPHYKCLRCEQLFINKFVFFRHIEKGKCYVNSCDVCSDTFEKNSDFYQHYVSTHNERAICNFCFRTFMYEKNVKEHMLRHLDQFRHRCEECNKGFYTVREYRNHYKNRHMGIRHKCNECGRSFADEYYFKRHLATHGIY